jgi:methanol--5-hydroxybenzimidazolylcobamide Co-methyltransferase
MATKQAIAIQDPKDLVYGIAPKPVTCGNGLEIGTGKVWPELNLTLPPMLITEKNLPEVLGLYRKAVTDVIERADALKVEGFMVEFEHLPPMTHNPTWGAEVTAALREAMDAGISKYGIKLALRATPVDIREPQEGKASNVEKETATLLESFRLNALAGADLLAIESTGGKEVTDQALMMCDLPGMIRGLAVIGAPDCEALWREITAIANAAPRPCVSSGDTACGFANTAMVLADRGYIPRVFSAIVRVMSTVRSYAAFRGGAVGPGKDCGYENIVCKALVGAPVSMEGRGATYAHLSPIGNVAAVSADLWSNESIEIGRTLSGSTVVASFEQLAYDCRLMNVARERDGEDGARKMRDWMSASDASLDPQAWVLTPEMSVELAKIIAAAPDDYTAARKSAVFALDSIVKASREGRLALPAQEEAWLDSIEADLDGLPDKAENLQ